MKSRIEVGFGCLGMIIGLSIVVALACFTAKYHQGLGHKRVWSEINRRWIWVDDEGKP